MTAVFEDFQKLDPVRQLLCAQHMATAEEIAEKIGRSRYAVDKIIRKLAKSHKIEKHFADRKCYVKLVRGTQILENRYKILGVFAPWTL